MQIGADIIDQYKTDGMPTTINFIGPWWTSRTPPTTENDLVSGMENLPYFSELLLWPYRPLSDSSRYNLERIPACGTLESPSKRQQYNSCRQSGAFCSYKFAFLHRRQGRYRPGQQKGRHQSGIYGSNFFWAQLPSPDPTGSCAR